MKAEILNFIRANGKASLAMLQQKFSLGYKEATEVLAELMFEEYISYDDENFYRIKKRSERNKSKKNNDYVPDLSDRDFLEKRRRLLMRRLRLINAERENDESDDDSEQDDCISLPDIIDEGKLEVDLIDEVTESDDIEFDRRILLQYIKKSIKSLQKGKQLFVRSLFDEDLTLEIINDGERLFFTDNGAVMARLADKGISVEGNIKMNISDLLGEYDVRLIDNALQLEVSGDNVSDRFRNLCYVAKRICDIDKSDAELMKNLARLDKFKFEILRQLILTRRNIKKSEAILLMKDKYMKCKDSQDFEKIITYAQAVRELSILTDSQFESYRKKFLSE